MSEVEDVFWLTIHHDVLDRNKLGDWLKPQIHSVGTTAYLAKQSIDEARIRPLTAEHPFSDEDFASTFAGRVFGAEAELRWALRGKEFDVWSIREGSTDSAHSHGPFHRKMIHYYCLGRWNQSERKYLEGNITATLEYPLDGNKDDDRFYVAVYEYFPAPTFGMTDLNELMDALNRPRVVAARFCGVGVGPKSGDGEGRS